MTYEALCYTEADGTRVVVFPTCPGCQTQADPGEDVDAMAAEALAGWLEVQLEHGASPPEPRRATRAERHAVTDGDAGWTRREVPVAPRLAAALALRWARRAHGLSQGQLADRLGVSRQFVSQLESPDANPTLETLERAAAALGRRLALTLTP